MAESKPDWKKEVAEIVRTEIEKIKPKLQSPPSLEPKESEHKTHGSIEEILSCPDCGPKFYPAMKKAVIEREFKDADYECEECGLPAKEEESGKDDWECPSCGHKYARPK